MELYSSEREEKIMSFLLLLFLNELLPSWKTEAKQANGQMLQP